MRATQYISNGKAEQSHYDPLLKESKKARFKQKGKILYRELMRWAQVKHELLITKKQT